MYLIVNGKKYDNLEDDITMRELLDHLKLPAKKIAIERNREIVSKSTYDSVRLNDGDIIEIIHFIGGG
ncbi:MAG: sulfur carrier protein ThiS [Hellea sp.]|mgnify:CR=1 FL=1|nr:sulfur carrier protein ThiS [Hellea sp.]MDG1523135.1 sulfur carrier protein ThiS [Hellea sp.]MDG1666726.1 sulfur carrier protein ThiS [Hellea sp.]MDG2362445.1 sulfur carrier protein ThiS [Hellea sp.]|tara:strand:+ start:523 stop:726 length:204 start_codon:yes stop_codon:yes gene_type:complete